MEFNELYNSLSGRLNKLATKMKRTHGAAISSIDKDDLYQEMVIYLWEKYRKGVPQEFNDSYLVKGCHFHILNYLRKKRNKVSIVSLDNPINEDGTTVKDILYNRGESVRAAIDNGITMEQIKNNGFSKREKDVFSLLLEGVTVRAAGSKLGISHVMVVKHKKNLIAKWQRK
ncbi:MAG: sigma-70 family RNA polymerase sigma factor [Candidatus Omnitrophica bacterium]|nr:sigma-70 family RNA polymerase sigma factor [Candidatus Omnitrophota bacterium]